MNDAISRLWVRLHALRHDDRGATAVEYGLIVGLIAVVIIGAVALLGGSLAGWFGDINTCIANPSAEACS